MPEPKIEMEKKNDVKAQKPQQPAEVKQPEGQLSPEEMAYWNWVRNAKLLEVSNVALFKVAAGIIIVPTDAIGRPLLDSSLFVRGDSDTKKKLLGFLTEG